MKALLVIDYTNDFIAPNGALTCGDPGRKIDDRIKELADSFLKNGDYVIFPTDTHQKNDPYHPETKLFPPHNIKGTSGHDLYGKTAEWFNAHKDSDFVYQFDKNRYSSFQNTNLDNARAESPNSGSAVFAPTSAYSTRQLLLTTSIIL